MIKLFAALFVAVCVMGASYAEEIQLTPADFSANKPQCVAIKDDSMILTGNYVMLKSKRNFPNTPRKKYGIKGTFKALPNTVDSKVYIGFEPLDAQGKVIRHVEAIGVPNTLAKLVQDVQPEDTVLRVNDASKWLVKDSLFVAFKAEENGSDLPNRNISNGCVVKVEKKDTFWEITLKNPAGISAKTGEWIREHREGVYIYTGFGGTKTGLVDCAEKSSIFFPGAASFHIVILGNWMQQPKGEIPQMEIRNVRLTD